MGSHSDDAFDEDEVEKRYFLAKPTCFIIFGKPGSGKTTLAKYFAKVSKCVYVSVSTAIERSIENETKAGLKAKEILDNGDPLSEEIILELLHETLNCDEVQHHGYVLEGFPILVQDPVSVENQIKFLNGLPLSPEFIINLKIRDVDACNRLTGQKFDPITNKLYDHDFYQIDDDQIVPKLLDPGDFDDMIGEEGLEEEDDDEDDGDSNMDLNDDLGDFNFDNGMFELEDETPDSKKLVVDRLVTRNEEFPENIITSVADFRKFVLPNIEDYIGEQDQQKVVELDATLPAKTVLAHLRMRLDTKWFNNVITPIRLQGSEDQEEITEDTDAEDMLRSLAASEMIAPGFRWRRSRWGQICPVSLLNGSNETGKPEFSVSFLDKMYLLASEDAMLKFVTNPRKYLKPPQPTPPCKILILGPSLSGKTTLCKKMANKYQCKVVNVETIANERIDEIKQLKIDAKKKKNLASIVEKVKEISGEAEVDENNPQVQELLSQSATKENEEEDKFQITDDDKMDVLEKYFHDMYEGTDRDPSSGGWILDGFPRTKEQFEAVVERGIVPDEVIVFKEETSCTVLVERWNTLTRNGEPLDAMSEEDTEKKKEFENQLNAFDGEWSTMQSSVRNTHKIEPVLIMCNLDQDEALTQATKKIEAVFQYQGWEYTGMDQDEEEEDFTADDDFEEDEEEDSNNKKPFGETAHYCPVMLKERNVLWPGSSETAVKYREKVYFMSTSEAQEQFLENPEMYLPKEKSATMPPVRMLLLGPKGSGKTLHGRLLAKKFGVLHVSFKDRLQELIIHKMKKKIGPDFEFDDDLDVEETTEQEELDALIEEHGGITGDIKNAGNVEKEKEDGEKKENESGDTTKKEDEVEEVEEEEAMEELNDFEENIRLSIIEDEPLLQETLDEIVPMWWNEEPFKSKGFILEGFPRNADEVRYLSSAGYFPDGAIALNVQESNIVERLMPPVLERWRKKRAKYLARLDRKRNAQLKFREQERIRRKREKLHDREERRQEKLIALQTAGGEFNEEELEEDDEDDMDLDEIIEIEILEDFGDIEEDDMDEETEEEAIERIKEELIEKFEGEVSQVEGVQEVLEEFLIPRLDIDASRKTHITQYMMMKMLKPQVECRENLFDRCQPVGMELAKKLLNYGYKKPSRFGRWDPVKVFDGNAFPPYISREKPCYPVVYRHYVYYLSNEENRDRFIQTPQTFLQQASPKPLVPIRVAIIGPPKSGKTTLAKRLEKEFGVVRLSIGEAIRRVMYTHAHTKLVKQIEEYLLNGFPLPDELAIETLQIFLMEPVCHNKGFVLDGYPVTSKQMELLHERSIIPYKVIHLNVTDKEIMVRGAIDRRSPNKMSALHDSHTILAIRVACHRREEKPILEFYKEGYKNLVPVDGERSKWWVFNKVVDEVQIAVQNIQTYIERVAKGHAACIKYMCITPKKLDAQLGEFKEYCPVSLAENNELYDCSSQTSHDLIAEYRGKYYRFPDAEKMERFLQCPSKYVYPLAPHPMPVKEDLPRKKSATYLKKIFPQEIELKGYCPVTFYEGNFRYESIQPGETTFLVEYKKKIFSFLTEECQVKFLRSPEKYSNLKLPKKLPPKKEPVLIASLPMLGYMEQSVQNAIIKSMTAVGCLKPKYPFLSAKRSSLLYLAYHLKATNPKSSEYVRKKYQRKLGEFENNCDLIIYLSKIMRWKYMEPEDRPIDFDHKLTFFNSMQYPALASS